MCLNLIQKEVSVAISSTKAQNMGFKYKFKCDDDPSTCAGLTHSIVPAWCIPPSAPDQCPAQNQKYHKYLLNSPFFCMFSQQLHCSGCNTSRMHDHQIATSISIDLVQSKPAMSNDALTLHHCLLDYIQAEEIEGFECESCCCEYLVDKLRHYLRKHNRCEKDRSSSESSSCASLNPQHISQSADDATSHVISLFIKQLNSWKVSGSICQSGYESWNHRIDEYIHRVRSALDAKGANESIQETFAVDEEEAVELRSNKEIKLRMQHILEYMNEQADSVRETVHKRMNMSRNPEILCIHVKRIVMNPFTGLMEKCNHYVQFPLELNCYRYTYEYQLARQKHKTDVTDPKSAAFVAASLKYKYRLISVVVHMGLVDNGHYVTYSRVKQQSDTINHNHQMDADMWVLLSDTNIREVSVGHVLKQQAFLLYYEKYV